MYKLKKQIESQLNLFIYYLKDIKNAHVQDPKLTLKNISLKFAIFFLSQMFLI